MNGDYLNEIKSTDPEFEALFRSFACEEVVNEPGNTLDAQTRYLAILATLLGCGGADLFGGMIPEALEAGVTPVELKEVLYQAVAYLGIGRVYPFFEKTNAAFIAAGINLPLQAQSTTTASDREEKGEQTQVDIFGERFRGFSKSGSEETRHINRWLSANCFGDYYTRTGLDKKQREMITLCYILAQGGCEAQLRGHIAGNFSVGNDSNFLISVISQCMPYIGYPRTLNALNCIKEITEAK